MMRLLRWYLAGAALARAGDEMSGPAVLLLGFAVTGAPGAGAALLAGLTISAAAGGLVFGALLDRARRALALPGAEETGRPPPARSLPRQIADGFAAIWTRRPLLRATVASAVSYVGIGMLLVSCPVLGEQRLGGSARGARWSAPWRRPRLPPTRCSPAERSAVGRSAAARTGGCWSAR
jgi:hypothetical protein